MRSTPGGCLLILDVPDSLPKSGPVQTNYEEKLTLYALYKQGERVPTSYARLMVDELMMALATEGDIRITRPGLLDMLGRAKWCVSATRSLDSVLIVKSVGIRGTSRRVLREAKPNVYIFLLSTRRVSLLSLSTYSAHWRSPDPEEAPGSEYSGLHHRDRLLPPRRPSGSITFLINIIISLIAGYTTAITPNLRPISTRSIVACARCVAGTCPSISSERITSVAPEPTPEPCTSIALGR